MSSPYVPGTAWVPTSGIDLIDDGDPATVAGLVATDEAALDRTEQFTLAKWVALGSVPFHSIAANFAREFNFNGVVTTVTAATGGDFKCSIPVVHGATIASIDVMFVADTGHTGITLTGPTVTLSRWAVGPSGGAPAGSASVVSTATYVPVSLGNYNNGFFKVMTVSPAHVADALSYVYELVINDEYGADEEFGATFIAYRVNYA